MPFCLGWVVWPCISLGTGKQPKPKFPAFFEHHRKIVAVRYVSLGHHDVLLNVPIHGNLHTGCSSYQFAFGSQDPCVRTLEGIRCHHVDNHGTWHIGVPIVLEYFPPKKLRSHFVLAQRVLKRIDAYQRNCSHRSSALLDHCIPNMGRGLLLQIQSHIDDRMKHP